MNLSNSKGSTSSSHLKTADAAPVSDQFPAGLRVLVVDDDPTCLMILERMLRACLYEVTKCKRAEVALSLLRENKNGFDIVLSDVHMPDMDGFKLLEHIGLEMDLPVIMMSADDGKNVVMKGVTHGACDYLIKPVRIEALKNIWQHVIRKRKNGSKDVEQSGSVEEGDRPQRGSDDGDYSSSVNEGKSSKKRRDEDEDGDERDDTSTLKKPRIVWSVELHQQFMAAVNQLGIDKAVPKKILELMNVPGLTRENVASHLQMTQSQPRGHMLSEKTGSHVTRFPSSLVQPTVSNGISNGVLGNGIAGTSNITASYNPVPQNSSLLSFPMNQTNEMSVSSFSLRSTPGITSSIPSKGLFHEEGTSDIKGPGGFVQDYDIFNELHHQKPHDWDLTNTGMTYDASQHANPLQANIDVSPSVLVHQSFPSMQQTVQNRDTTIGKAMFSTGEGIHQSSLQNVGQHHNNLLVDNSVRVKAEKILDPGSQINNLFSDQYGQDDLVSAFLKQEGIGPSENEFDFDGYSLDNIPV
ncbi:hypothetical protein VNO78_04647 [Psophocarpus tetragonolobus]|uniref:Two-component response regulator n=1 Tax=Psophocarpus tetragonolobus TaxID=3891 RepID=A0AAN9XWR3_PSOTE